MLLNPKLHVWYSWDYANDNFRDALSNFRSAHPGGAYFLFADGSVKWVNESIDDRTYKELSTVRGGEIVDDSTW